MPSRLAALYEEVSYQDIRMKIRLRAEEKMAETMQAYETFCLVANAALGGKPRSADPRTAPKTAAELEAVLTKALG